MKRIFACAGLAGALALSSPLFAQARANNPYTLNHVELGAYGDLFRVAPVEPQPSTTRHRRPFRLQRQPQGAARSGDELQLREELHHHRHHRQRHYHHQQHLHQPTAPAHRPLRPKFQIGTSGPLRAFITAKGGFIEYSYSNNAPSGAAFTNAFNQFNSGGNTHFAAYPGGGIEFFADLFRSVPKPATRHLAQQRNRPGSTTTSASPLAPPYASNARIKPNGRASALPFFHSACHWRPLPQVRHPLTPRRILPPCPAVSSNRFSSR